MYSHITLQRTVFLQNSNAMETQILNLLQDDLEKFNTWPLHDKLQTHTRRHTLSRELEYLG